MTRTHVERARAQMLRNGDNVELSPFMKTKFYELKE